jgi:methionyl-tRNA formyltransferase
MPTAKKLRVIFMGTPAFAVPCLEVLLRDHEVVAVVSRPDEPQGRGQKLQSPPVAELAKQANVPLFQPLKIRTPEFLQTLTALAPEVIVVVAYGRILPKEILELPPFGCINVHASLLPKYRGSAPIQWAIVRGEAESGVTVMKMDEGMDTGPMIMLKKLAISPEMTGETLYAALSSLGAAALAEALPRYASGQLTPTPQPSEGASMAPMLKKEDGRVDWTKTTKEIVDLVRGMKPWPVTHAQMPDGSILRVLEATSATGQGAPGAVLQADPKKKAMALLVATQDGAVSLTQVQQEGRKVQPGDIFAMGNKLKVGDVLR